MFFSLFRACNMSFLALYSSIFLWVWCALLLIINFLFSIDLLVVIICCSNNCWLKEKMKFSNLCCQFAKLLIAVAKVAIAFANFNSWAWSFSICFSTWFSCVVNLLSSCSSLSFIMSLYDFSWYCVMLAISAPTNTDISTTTASVTSLFSLIFSLTSVILPYQV